MTPRLAHKKSRRGCQRCKTRKVKCDEIHPKCTNCSRHEVTCEYGDPFVGPSGDADKQHRVNSTHAFESSSTISPNGPDSPYADLEDIDHVFTASERRLMELRLLHHYMTVVITTFSSGPFQQMWYHDSVRLGFEHPFLLNAIFAITSLHIVCDAAEKSPRCTDDERVQSIAHVMDRQKLSSGDTDHAKAHRIYLNLAVRTQREAISALNADNANAVFLASVLLSYQALKLLPDSPKPDVYQPPTQWLRMSTAISTVVQATRPLVQEGSLVEWIKTTQMEPDFMDEGAIFDPESRKPFETLLNWSSYPEPDLDFETKNTYERTLAYIGGVWQAILDKEEPKILFRRLVSLGILIPPQFTTFLEQGRPRALAVIAHHFAMMKAGEEHWWLRGVADREVIGIQSVLPAEWQWAMEWPLSVLQQGISYG